MNPSKPRFSPILVMLCGVLAVSTGSLFIRFAQQEAPSLVIAAYRLSLAAILLLPVALLNHRRELQELNGQDWLIGLFSGAFLALHFATWTTSLEFTGVTSSVVFVNTAPLWVALISPLVLHEHLSRQAWLGVLISFAGGLLVGLAAVCSLSSSGVSCNAAAGLAGKNPLWGNFLALCGAWALAGYLILGRKLRPRISLTGYIFIVYGIAALIMVAVVSAFVSISGLAFSGFSPQTYLWLLLLALIPQLLGHSASNYALAYLSASFVAVALLGEPVGSTILAGLFLHEVPSALTIVGGFVTLIGIVLVSRG